MPEFKIQPKPAETQSTRIVDRTIGEILVRVLTSAFYGVLLGYFVVVGVFIVGSLWLQDEMTPRSLAPVWAGVLFAFMAHSFLTWSGTLDAANKKLLAAAAEEAARATARVSAIVDSIGNEIAKLHRLYAVAREMITLARHEYEEHAFSPYCDAVQKSAMHLAAAQEVAVKVKQLTMEYQEILLGRVHDFPRNPAPGVLPPDFSSLGTQFSEVVRAGQTDIRFAEIWEHRMTREAVIQGFKTLGDAVTELGECLRGSFGDLSKSLEVGFARLAVHQAETLEANTHLVAAVAENTSDVAESTKALDGRVAEVIRIRRLDRTT